MEKPNISTPSKEKPKEISIVINARPKQWHEKMISYEQVVMLAFGSIQSDMTTVYTVTFKGGEEKKKEGLMVPGDVINVKDKMIFNVTSTNKS